MISTILITLPLRKYIHSANPLYLIIHSATECFKEKNGEKYLIIDSTEKYEEAFSKIKSEIEKKTMLELV